MAADQKVREQFLYELKRLLRLLVPSPENQDYLTSLRYLDIHVKDIDNLVASQLVEPAEAACVDAVFDAFDEVADEPDWMEMINDSQYRSDPRWANSHQAIRSAIETLDQHV